MEEKRVYGLDKPRPKKLKDYVSEVIRKSEPPPELSPSNMFNAYRKLYDLIRKSLTLTISLKRQIDNLQIK